MRLAAASELAAGRWSVAEGLFGAVQENERFLSPAERGECRRLADEIRRSRDLERQVQGLVLAAASLAANGRFPEARELALQMMRECPDAALVARLRRILGGLPHPLGRLLYGFDSPLEVERFVRPEGGASVEAVSEENHPLGGGYLRVRLPREGASIELLDPPQDWSGAREFSLCARLVMPARAALRISAGGVRGSWVHDAKILDPYWNQLRIPRDRFVLRGEADWSSIARLSLASAGPEPAELMLDELRLKPGSVSRAT
jgi:hypothetical protein